jgi:exosortase
LLLLGLVLLLVHKSPAEALSQNDSLFFTTLGLVAWLVGGFVCLFGTQALRKSLFALLFLLFMVHVPSVVMGPIVTFLQTGSAYAARVVLSLLGVPVYFEGMLISLPGVTVEVAEECSGVRSAMVLTMLSTFAA